MNRPLRFPIVRCLALASVLALALAAASGALAQCAMCSGAADATSGEFAYSKSTIFMLSVPYLLLGGVAGYVVHAFRRARAPSRDGEGRDPAGP
jgi:hypothetical protein